MTVPVAVPVPVPGTGTLPPHWHWNTWDSAYPARFSYVPLGVHLTPVMYADSTGAASAFPPGSGVTFGPRTIDGRAVSLDLELSGSRLAWLWESPAPFLARGRWTVSELGEWGLRVWVVLAVSGPLGSQCSWDADSGSAVITLGHRSVAVAPALAPTLVTGHRDLEALTGALVEHGYWDLTDRTDTAPVLALRFPLFERDADYRFAAAVADAPAAARLAARAALDDSPAMAPLPADRPIDAVRDVMGWNTVFDPVNGRRHVTASRLWNQRKFGGYGVWLTDVLYHGLMASLVDPGLALDTLTAALAGATPDGNLPCLLTGKDAWIDRSQPPVAAHIALAVARRTDAWSWLADWLPTLAANHAWWLRRRQPSGQPNGLALACYGTTPGLGSGLYANSAIGARIESAQENNPTLDGCTFDPETGLLQRYDVGLNAWMALDAEALATICRRFGDNAGAERHGAAADARRRAVALRLWDDQRGVFASRDRAPDGGDGAFCPSLAPTSLFPLAAGATDPTRATQVVATLLDTAEKLGGWPPLPSVTRDDPAFADNVYWRGRVWGPHVYWGYVALRRAGLRDRAAKLADDAWRLFRLGWDRRICAENYNGATGAPDDTPDSDRFYGWGALLAYIAVIDADPENAPDIAGSAPLTVD